jgi:hypothetical protein
VLGNKANQLKTKMMANKAQEIEGLGTGLHSLVDLGSLGYFGSLLFITLSPVLHLSKHLLKQSL